MPSLVCSVWTPVAVSPLLMHYTIHSLQRFNNQVGSNNQSQPYQVQKPISFPPPLANPPLPLLPLHLSLVTHSFQPKLRLLGVMAHSTTHPNPSQPHQPQLSLPQLAVPQQWLPNNSIKLWLWRIGLRWIILQLLHLRANNHPRAQSGPCFPILQAISPTVPQSHHQMHLVFRAGIII